MSQANPLSESSSPSPPPQSASWDREPPLRRYFVAVLPTKTVQDRVDELKRDLGQTYDCKPVWNSPPHVTLLPPFERSPDHLPRLNHWIAQVSATMPAFELAFKGLGAFPPRILFVDLVRSPELMKLQGELELAFEEFEAPYEYSQRPDRPHGDRPFKPHMTLARCRAKRRGGKNPFHIIWPAIRDRPFQGTSAINEVVLLEYLDQTWEIHQTHPLLS